MQKLKIGVILLCILQPIIMLYYFGWEFKSYSKCWGTDLEPLFIITNATTSYFFFHLNRWWKVSAILLMLTTAFSTDVYPQLHNILAVFTFVSMFFALFEYKSLRIYPLLFALAIGFGGIFSLFWLEVGGSYVACIYHLHVMTIKNKFKNRNNEK